MRPKIFDRQFEGRYVPRRLNEDVWFKRHQALLLWMCKHPDGRKLLRLDQTNIGEIHEIAKNFVRHNEYVRDGKLWRRVTTTDFRTGAKWANLIRYQWEWFCELAAEYNYEFAVAGIRNPFGIGLVPGLAFTVSTFYPDPNPETTTCDGKAQREPGANTWADIHDGAGTAGRATEIGEALARIGAGTDPNYTRIFRAFYLFDTSSIPDGDPISSAILSQVGGDSQGLPKTDPLAISPTINIYTTTPASNTDIVAADYQQIGTVAQATAITYANWSNTAYNDFTLNATGRGNISLTGVTKFGSREATYDAPNSPPSPHPGAGDSYLGGLFAESTGTSSDPKLVVTHGGTTYERTPSETQTITESLVRAWIAPRTLSTETNTPTESLTRAWTAPRTLTEGAITITEVIQALRAVLVSISESIGLTDVLTRAVTYARTLTSTLSITEALTRVKITALSLSESLGITEALTRVFTFGRTLTESLSITEWFAMPLNWLKRTKLTTTWTPRQRP